MFSTSQRLDDFKILDSSWPPRHSRGPRCSRRPQRSALVEISAFFTSQYSRSPCRLLDALDVFEALDFLGREEVRRACDPIDVPRSRAPENFDVIDVLDASTISKLALTA